MKYLPLALCVLATHATAQNTFTLRKPVVCSDLPTMAAVLDEYKEKLYWQSKDGTSNNNITLFLNSETLSWSLVESNKDVACFLSTGEGYRTKPSGGSSGQSKKPSNML